LAPFSKLTLKGNEGRAKFERELEIVRAGVRLLSGLSFVKRNHKRILAAGTFECLIESILYSFHDAEIISFASRAIYVLYKEKREEVKDDEEDKKKMKAVMEKYADQLIRYLIDVVIQVEPAKVKYPSTPAYMLRHLGLLLFLFSSDLQISKKMLTKNENEKAKEKEDIIDALYMLLNKTAEGIQINAVAVIANFVETDEGAKRVAENEKLVRLLENMTLKKNKILLMRCIWYLIKQQKEYKLMRWP